jgi:hypothetical protein
VVFGPKRDLSRSSDNACSNRIGRSSLRKIGFLGLILLGLSNFTGCFTLTGSLSAPESQIAPPMSNRRAAADYGVATFGVGSAPPEATPTSVAFGNVIAGASYAQTVLLSNVGSADLSITQISTSGDGFGVSGYSLPLTLATGQSAPLAVTFESSTPGSATGSVSIASNAGAFTTTVGLTATVGAPTVQISATPTAVAFGNIAIGSGATQNVILTNTGNSTVNIASATAEGTGFAASAIANYTLTPGQSIVVPVNFNPSSAGTATGTFTLVSNAPQMQIGLSGTGVAPVVGYYVYRGTGATPVLVKLSSAIVQGIGFNDTSVVPGQTYTYAVTSVDANNVESTLSNPVSVTVP